MCGIKYWNIFWYSVQPTSYTISRCFLFNVSPSDSVTESFVVIGATYTAQISKNPVFIKIS